MHRHFNTTVALLAASLLAGCQQQDLPQAEIHLQEEQKEQWSIILLSGERIGWEKQTQQIVQREAESLLVTRQQIRTSIQRGDDLTELELLLVSTTTLAGELKEFSQSETSGPLTTTVTGRQLDGELHIERGENVTTIPWNPRHGGFFSVARMEIFICATCGRLMASHTQHGKLIRSSKPSNGPNAETGTVWHV